eukprot:CAMPEP_0201921690 /NCGR_PEP_ID=MMETSP0903-20130614/9949_1 /ASSEMBLY_ACC=CAM_ASM_000552 /TAXON_ID=420261 /ORGANISM="Thalassiosira antarctica, Strain CCMP982" /LENGTH=401 /DNA_ID=CAMNT_0048458695 /DNA_START=35 /DNA_END=1240 /DNA_ORIENTATION=-
MTILLKMEGLAALLFIFLAHHRVSGDKFCGVDLSDAQNTCWQPCNSDSDCCASSQQCFEASSCKSYDLSGVNHNFCGVSWCDAAYNCGNTPCPKTTECPDGQSCYADIPCNTVSSDAPPLPAPPTASPYQFCGNSMSAAKSNCWQPCPRGRSDCCLGLGCFDTSTDAQSGVCGTNSDYSGSNHFFCGSSWCNAAYSCQTACPGGMDKECSSGQFCYADVPCSGGQSPPLPPDVVPPSSIFSKYCGTSAENAAQDCWQPCRDDDDCCFGQTCYSGVTSCSYPDNIGADHFFCGSDFCEAVNTCQQSCPTGFDAQCPGGQRCFANTPCNANIRSTTARTLDYGLPRNAMNLIRQYRPDTGQGQTNAQTAASGPMNSFPVGLLFVLCLISLLALNFVWSRITSA